MAKYKNQHRRSQNNRGTAKQSKKQTVHKSAKQEKQDQQVMVEQGQRNVQAGVMEIGLARDVADGAMAEVAAGASNVTRAVDAAVVADRLGTLSNVVAAAGVNDIAQGADLMMASDDVQAMSAAVGLMSLGDLESGLHLGRMAGELDTIAQVVAKLEMPMLAAILEDRSIELQDIATTTVLRSASTRGLSELMSATGKELNAMGETEMDEGVLRVAAAEIAQQRADELEYESVSLGIQGAAELADAAQAMDVAAEVANEGVARVAVGSAQMVGDKRVEEIELG